MSHEIPHQPTPLFLFKGKTKLSGGTTGQRSGQYRRTTGFSEKESRKSKWVVGEDLMTSRLSKVVVFPILLTREANSMFRETDTGKGSRVNRSQLWVCCGLQLQ